MIDLPSGVGWFGAFSSTLGCPARHPSPFPRLQARATVRETKLVLFIR